MNENDKKMVEVFTKLEEEGVNPDSYQHLDPQGLGDTIKDIFEAVGVTEEVIKKITGIKLCNCDARRKFFNKVLPYWWKNKEES
jgi:hypothetical protein